MGFLVSSTAANLFVVKTKVQGKKDENPLVKPNNGGGH